jgi:FAD binding domain in molybdopterin dehydrogenase
MLTCDDYLTLASLDEAFDAMAEHRGHYRIVAGATDTLPWAREGRAGDVHIPALIDVTKIPELRELSGRQARATRSRHAYPTISGRSKPRSGIARHAALRGMVRR